MQVLVPVVYRMLTAQADRRDLLLDRDSPKAVHAEGGHHGSHERPWREDPHETVQRAEQIRR